MAIVQQDHDYMMIAALLDVAVYAVDRIPFGTPEQVVAVQEVERLNQMHVQCDWKCVRCYRVIQTLYGSFQNVRMLVTMRRYCDTCLHHPQP